MVADWVRWISGDGKPENIHPDGRSAGQAAIAVWLSFPGRARHQESRRLRWRWLAARPTRSLRPTDRCARWRWRQCGRCRDCSPVWVSSTATRISLNHHRRTGTRCPERVNSCSTGACTYEGQAGGSTMSFVASSRSGCGRGDRYRRRADGDSAQRAVAGGAICRGDAARHHYVASGPAREK